jgi:quercetin dioxygenase-like cupin family protein
MDALKVTTLSKTEVCEVLLITIETGYEFPEHSSPRDAILVMLSGNIMFHIKGNVYSLSTHQSLQFEAGMIHAVKAKSDSKFLIIR